MSQANSRTFDLTSHGVAPKVPAHLSRSAKRWWRTIVEEYDLEPYHIPILTAAVEAWDRKEEARSLIAEEGLVVGSGSGEPRPHPAVEIEDQAALRMARLLREIGLDETPAQPGRAG